MPSRRKPQNPRRKKARAKSRDARPSASARVRPGKGVNGLGARARAKRIGALFEALVALQARLRAPRGCPWDRQQTHQTLRTYLIEEAYEVLDALDSGDHAKIAGELGDLLLQIIFHAQLAREAGQFDIADVIEKVHTKMVRRHPHVFGGVKARTAAQVLRNWEQLKAEERRAELSAVSSPESDAHASLLDGVPRTLPALLEAYQLTRRASRIGFDWDEIAGLLDKLAEETRELRQELHAEKDASASQAPARPSARLEEEVGDLLFVAVNIARFLAVDPEIALKNATRKFIARFQEMERQAARQGRRLAEASREQQEALWEAAKRQPHAAAASREK